MSNVSERSGNTRGRPARSAPNKWGCLRRGTPPGTARRRRCWRYSRSRASRAVRPGTTGPSIVVFVHHDALSLRFVSFRADRSRRADDLPPPNADAVPSGTTEYRNVQIASQEWSPGGSPREPPRETRACGRVARRLIVRHATRKCFVHLFVVP